MVSSLGGSRVSVETARKMRSKLILSLSARTAPRGANGKNVDVSGDGVWEGSLCGFEVSFGVVFFAVVPTVLNRSPWDLCVAMHSIQQAMNTLVKSAVLYVTCLR